MSNYNENNIKEAAYYNWMNAGCPAGQDEYFWSMAVKQLSGENCNCNKSKTTKNSASKTCSSSSSSCSKSATKSSAKSCKASKSSSK